MKKANYTPVERIPRPPHSVERVLIEGQPSLWPAVLAGGLTLALLLFSLALWILVGPTARVPVLSSSALSRGLIVLFGLAWCLCLLLVLVQVGSELVARLNTRFKLTEQRLVLNRGVFRRSSKMLIVKRIQDVSIEQGLLARAVGYGSVRVESAGERGMVVLNDVPHPQLWRDYILGAVTGQIVITV
jgi:uncharacterized membrane protein YdbT with pleckstrin-like domain